MAFVWYKELKIAIRYSTAWGILMGTLVQDGRSLVSLMPQKTTRWCGRSVLPKAMETIGQRPPARMRTTANGLWRTSIIGIILGHMGCWFRRCFKYLWYLWIM